MTTDHAQRLRRLELALTVVAGCASALEYRIVKLERFAGIDHRSRAREAARV